MPTWEDYKRHVRKTCPELRTDLDKIEALAKRMSDECAGDPADDPWAMAEKAIGEFPEDFLPDRNQPEWEDVPKQEEF